MRAATVWLAPIGPHSSKSAPKTTKDDVRIYLRDSARTYRNRGYTQEHAVVLVAEFYGLQLRRAQRMIFGSYVKMLDDEIEALRERYKVHLAADVDHLKSLMEASRERLRCLEAGEPIDWPPEYTEYRSSGARRRRPSPTPRVTGGPIEA